MNKTLWTAQYALPAVVVLLVVAEILFTNHLASYGSEVYDTDAQIAVIEQQNSLLETQIASASSFLTIQTKAAEYGFVEPSKSQFVSLIPEQPVAFNKPQ